jgi:hypothetical protein
VVFWGGGGWRDGGTEDGGTNRRIDKAG